MTKIVSKKISRRDALKVLTAAAGAATLANIPSKWSKPGLEVGMLPAHAQTSLPVTTHTLTAGADQLGVGYCFDTVLTSTVTISPATSGISMAYTINAAASVTISSPLTGTVLTDATGTATLNFTAADISGSGTITVVWGFANASDGTGSDNQLFTPGGC